MNDAVPVTRALVDVAMGRRHAEVVVQNGRWVCVQTGEILEGIDLAVSHGKIAYVGTNAGHCIGPSTRTIDARDRYLLPGLLDAHMHVESSMLTVTEFVRAVMPHGTTGIFIDPHEIANVFGLRGVRLMLNEAAKQPIHVWVQVPSCVPSAPGLETAGASIGPDEVAEAVRWPGVIGLGEMMNFPGVYAGDRRMLTEMALAKAAGKIVSGHYASGDLGNPFHAYAVAGAEDDHEGTKLEDAVARARQGMRPMLRYGSAAHDVAAQVGAITELHLESRRFMLCTDDSHAETLAVEGHMDRVIRHAIAQGLEPMVAIQMATVNTAEHFGLSKEIGMIAPGRWADILLAESLSEVRPSTVIAKGQIVAQEGKLTLPPPSFDYPAWTRNSVHLKRPLRAGDFVLRAPGGGGRHLAHVIGVVENQLPTQHLLLPIDSHSGEVRTDIGRDLAKVALVQRHKGMSGTTLGLVQGFGFTEKCAAASTVAHDCHQLLVVGTDEDCMARAVSELAKNGGGQVVVKDGKVVGMVALSIAGLMSTSRAEDVAASARTVLDGFRECGCRINNPNIPLSFLALATIPALRITDMGLVDVERHQVIPVLEEA